MPSYEGLVIQTGDDGKAIILISPDCGSVIHAADRPKACRAGAEGSLPTVEGVNHAGAEAGDAVLVTTPGGARLGNFLLFLVLMMVGGGAGMLIFRLVDNRWAFSAYAGALVLLAALVPGAFLAVLFLRRRARGGEFVIDRVIRKGTLEESPVE